MGSISLILPTIGRPTLARALKSLRLESWRPGDEVLLIGDGPQPAARSLWEQFSLPGRYLELPCRMGFWGHGVRNWERDHQVAKGEYLMALDDDDQLAPGAMDTVRNAIAENPGRPHLFRMAGQIDGTFSEVWKTKQLSLGNVGTPMFVTPNGSRTARYVEKYGGDCEFIRQTCSMHSDEPVWREEVICLVRPWVPTSS